MSFPIAHQIMVHLVALGSGRTLVRTIETERSPVTEATLALIVRELLGTAFLFDSPEVMPTEVREVVRDVKKQIPVELVSRAPSPRASDEPTTAWAQARMGYPLAGGEDEVPVFHLGAALERRVPFGLDASLGLSGSFASISRPQTEGARFLTVGGTAAAYRGFPLSTLSWGPFAAASLEYGAFRIPGSLSGFALPSLALGGQVRSVAPAGAVVALSMALDMNANREELRGPDGLPLYRTPAVELMLALAVGWGGP
jgi:hypothetical protein